jgi:transglutaminase-like putative cysteine protease
MRIRAGFELSVRSERPTSLLGLLNVHPSRTRDLLGHHAIESEPERALDTFTDAFGNLAVRTLAPAGVLTLRADFTISQADEPPPPSDVGELQAVHTLPVSTLQFLSGSRYCETDKLSAAAWSLFGDVPSGIERVQEIVRYVHDRLTFGYEYASSTRTAWEAYQERRGVCRDYVHLAVALCRAMNIPSRYCSGYLADIDVPPSDIPMDFSAWMEAYLGDRWYTFDPRHGQHRRGHVLMAMGRDAADVPLYTTYGPSELIAFRVFADEAFAQI